MAEIWTFLTRNDIMSADTDGLLELINMTKQEKKEKQILAMHIENFYHIWTNSDIVKSS